MTDIEQKVNEVKLCKGKRSDDKGLFKLCPVSFLKTDDTKMLSFLDGIKEYKTKLGCEYLNNIIYKTLKNDDWGYCLGCEYNESNT